MQANQIAIRAGAAVHKDPEGSLKAVFVILLIIAAFVIFYKLLRGFGKVTDIIADAGPSTEAEKLESISAPVYQEGIKWLGDRIGIEAIIRGGFKNIDTYFAAKKFPWASLLGAAEKIWNAKMPGYISETEIYNAIAGLPSRAAVSIMAGVFNQVYKKSAGFYPLETFLGKYLKLSELNTLTALISKKPAL